MAINTLKADPSRTTMLRKKWMADIARRFQQLDNDIWQWLVVEDELALEERKVPTAAGLMFNARTYEFRTDAQKTAAFREYLTDRVDSGILSVDGKGEPWTQTYVNSAYRQGVVRGYTDTLPGAGQKLDFYNGSREQFLRDAFAQPETVSKLEMLSTRTFENMRGLTEDMKSSMNRVLTDGVAHGEGPRSIARSLRETTGMGRRRAETVARTETIHAHSEGQLDSFERLGVEEVGLDVEWQTAGDKRVCPRCQAQSGQVYTTKEARGMLPLHPNCRCAWLPSFKKAKKRDFSMGGVVSAPSVELWGEQPTAVIRWMGKEGWNFKEARAALDDLNVEVKDATIRAQLTAGKKGERGDPAKLTAEQAAKLEDKRQAIGITPPKPKPPKPPTPVVTKPVLPKPVELPKPATLPAKASEIRPAHITFTGPEETDFAKSVWKEVGEGYKDLAHVNRVGQMVIDSVEAEPKMAELALRVHKAEENYKGLEEQYRQLAMTVSTTDEEKASRSKTIAAWTEAYTERNTAKLQFTNARKNLIQDKLREIRDFGKGDEVKLHGSKEEIGTIRDAMQHMPKDWLKKVDRRFGSLNVEKVERGYFRASTNEIALSGKAGTTSQLSTALHELTHAVEHSNMDLVHLENAFLKSRLKKGEVTTKIYKKPDEWGRYEMGYKDEFHDHYMGKVYDGYAFEVATMGMEGTMLGTRTFDDGVLKFMLGILAGL